jgi:hypothetical protein
MFLPVFLSFENQKKKTISQQGKKKQTRENNKTHSEIFELCLIIKISHIIDGKGSQTYYGLDKLTNHLDQQMFLMNHINAIILSQSLKLYFQTI